MRFRAAAEPKQSGNFFKLGGSVRKQIQNALLGVPKPGCLRFFTQKERSSAPFCALLWTCVCALLRSFAIFCVLLRPTAFRATMFGNCRPWLCCRCGIEAAEIKKMQKRCVSAPAVGNKMAQEVEKKHQGGIC